MENSLLILVFINLVAGLFCYYRLLQQLKKRNKSIESQLNRVNNWVVLNNQTIVQDLEKIKEIVTSLQQGGKIIEMNKQKEVSDKLTGNIEKEETNFYHKISHHFAALPYTKGIYNRMQEPESNYFYLAILEELQRINKTIHINRQPAKPGRINSTHTAYASREDTATVNGWNHRINKRI